MTHTVKSGESLSKIAASNGVSLEALLDANPSFKGHQNSIKPGDVLNIPGPNTEAAVPPPQPVAVAPPPTAANSELGKLSSKFEVGNRGPGTVSGGVGDPGGASYGSYQMTSKPLPGTVGRFVAQPDFPFRANFAGLPPGSGPFTTAWKQLAANDAAGFHEIQHTFIKRTHFDPLAAKISKEDGVDVATRSFALQNAIWSTAVQHGGNSSIPHVALQHVNAEKNDADFDKEFIVAIYNERGRKQNGVLVHFSKSSADVQKGVANRFKAEVQDALKMLSDETAQGNG